MENPFIEKMNKLSNEELLNIINIKNEYQPSAIEAVENILKERGSPIIIPKEKEIIQINRFEKYYYASFFSRMIAFIIDAMIFFIIGSIIVSIFEIELYGVINIGFLSLGKHPIASVIFWIYNVLFESSSYKATPGKQFMGIIVTDLEGKQITFNRATGRFFGKIISSVVLFLGFLNIAFHKKKQGFHDILASTIVINKNASHLISNINDNENKGIEQDIIQLSNLIFLSKKSIFDGNNCRKQIKDIIKNHINSKETAVILMEMYYNKFNKNLFKELNNISLNYDSVKDVFEHLINLNIVTKIYPYELI